MIPAPSPHKTRPVSRAAAAAAASAATGVSWMALVAATTLGVGHFDRVRAAICSDQPLSSDDDGQGYRLIVQSYAPANVAGDDFPPAHARPLGSAQRAVTPDQLAAGIHIDIMQFGDVEQAEVQPVIIAWVERGQPDLEFDALRARPAQDAFYGCSPVRAQGHDTARVVLKRRAA